MARRTKAEAERTRQIIVESGLREFSRRGLSGTTLDHVAITAGVTRGAIYWHFKNKYDLYDEVLSLSQQPIRFLVEAAAGSELPALSSLDNFMKDWLTLLTDNEPYRQSFEILLNKTELTADMQRTIDSERKLTRDVVKVLTTLLERGSRDGSMRSGLDAPTEATALYAYLMGLTQAWLFNPQLFDLRERASALVAWGTASLRPS